MPTVSVVRDRLFAAIGKSFTDTEFDELCFQFGLELDEIVKEHVDEQDNVKLGGRAAVAIQGDAAKDKAKASSGKPQEQVVYKIDVPANRYDLLCLEGLALGFRVFLGYDTAAPVYKLSQPVSMLKMNVKPSTSPIRPIVVCAVLRGVNLTPERYQSLIDLQDKLHQNICRKRSLVAIGTHDLDKIQGPFTYQARPPKEIQFVPLAKTESVDAEQLMKIYETDLQLKQYLSLIRDSPEYPLITDVNNTVLSLPPIINGDHSKITLQTKNIFIECTATDDRKANIVLNTLCSMFAGYCTPEPFVIEPVEVFYEASGKTVVTPDIQTTRVEADLKDVGSLIGIEVSQEQIATLLRKMQLQCSSASQGNQIIVECPITRSDVIHACDVAEDVAVAYGFDNIHPKLPNVNTIGKLLPLNQLCDLIRREGLAQSCFVEVLTWVTVSTAENFSLMRRPESQAVDLSNPKTLEFQQCRVSLLPGLLKTLRENRKQSIPIKLFEMGDVVLLDDTTETGAKNVRRLSAVYCASAAGFEVIQGLFERVMTVLGYSRQDYRLDAAGCMDDAFFPGRRANIVFRNNVIGNLGWVHPQVVANFDIVYPCSAFEINLEQFMQP